MKYPVLINPRCEHANRIKEAIETVNKLQGYFRLSYVEAKWLPNDEEEKKKVNEDTLRQLVETKYSPDPTIVVIQNPFRDNSYAEKYRNTYIISLAGWETDFAPPPLKVYTIYLFAEACLNFAADLSVEMMDNWAHDPPIGCIYDTFTNKKLIKLGMVAANLCGECEVKLSGMGLSDMAIQSVEEMLSFVRDFTIRRPRTMASKVFIGHGRSPVWIELKKFLEHLGLNIEEFNQEATAGVSTTERLQEMLKSTSFAFLIMTAEDLHADEKLHARENVVHEIGLFQGRLGFRKAIVLQEVGVTGFSNIHGLTHINFSKGKINNEAKLEICRTLEREQIIEPSITQALSRQLKQKK